MPKVRVKYTVEVTEYIDWAEDEMKDFDYDTLLCNLDPEKDSSLKVVEEITDVEVDDEPHEF